MAFSYLGPGSFPLLGGHRRGLAAFQSFEDLGFQSLAGLFLLVGPDEIANVLADAAVAPLLDLVLDEPLYGLRRGDIHGVHGVFLCTSLALLAKTANLLASGAGRLAF